jgi:putative addiction module component (TIGR02574 family)
MTSRNLTNELLGLSTAEKIELVEELWDSIPEGDEALALTPEQRIDLAQRLADADADPEGGTPWEVAREQVRQRKR